MSNDPNKRNSRIGLIIMIPWFAIAAFILWLIISSLGGS